MSQAAVVNPPIFMGGFTPSKDVLNNSNSCVLQGRRFSDGAMDAVFPQSGLVLCGLEAFFRRFRGHLPVFRRTHPCAAIKVCRTIHRFDSANNVLSCSVFFISPR